MNRVVIISWPDDPDRSTEVYGPFATDAERGAWVDECEVAAAEGWALLHGAFYCLTTVSTPFDPSALWEITASAQVYEEHPSDCGFCQSGEPMIHNYEMRGL